MVNQAKQKNDVELPDRIDVEVEDVALEKLKARGSDLEVVTNELSASDVKRSDVDSENVVGPPLEQPMREEALGAGKIERSCLRAGNGKHFTH